MSRSRLNSCRLTMSRRRLINSRSLTETTILATQRLNDSAPYRLKRSRLNTHSLLPEVSDLTTMPTYDLTYLRLISADLTPIQTNPKSLTTQLVSPTQLKADPTTQLRRDSRPCRLNLSPSRLNISRSLSRP